MRCPGSSAVCNSRDRGIGWHGLRVYLSKDPMPGNRVDSLGTPVKFGSTEVREQRLVAVNPVNPAVKGQAPRQQYNICA